MDQASSLDASFWTANLDVPQVAFFAPNPALTSSTYSSTAKTMDVTLGYSTTVGVSLTLIDHAAAIVDYLQHPIEFVEDKDFKYENLRDIDENSEHGVPRDYLTILYTPSQAALARRIQQEAPGQELETYLVEYTQAPPGVSLEDHRAALMRDHVWGPGYHTILIAMDRPGELVQEAENLDKLGLLNDENLFLFYCPELRADNLHVVFDTVVPDSAADRLMRGVAILTEIDGFMVPNYVDTNSKDQDSEDEEENEDEEETEEGGKLQYFDGVAQKYFAYPNATDAFLKHWHGQNASLFEGLALPPNMSYVPPTDYFQTVLPSPFSSYVYDAVMATGLGKCRQWKKEQAAATQSNNMTTTTTTTPIMEQDYPDVTVTARNDHVKEILLTRFQGASGSFAIDPMSKSRIRDGVPLGVLNLRSNGTTPDGFVRYQFRLTSISTELNEPWIEVEDFVYRDGTVIAPTTVRTIWEKNYLSTYCRVIGFVLWITAVLLCVGSAVVIFLYRNHKVMRAGQPFFLYLLCLGSLVSSTGIFTLSFEEKQGWSIDQLTIACMSTIWLFFMGNIIFYTALFSKIWRIDRVMQLRRKAVTIQNVLGPMAVVILCAMAVLLTWTLVDPFIWEREVQLEIPAESVGHCESESFNEFFIAMVFIMIIATGMTTYEAWKASDIPREFSDTKLVLYTVSSHLQAWIVGPPTLAVLGSHSSTDATYIGRIFLFWVFAVSGVLVVIGPKIWQVLFRKAPQPDKSRVRISGFDMSERKQNSVMNVQSSTIKGPGVSSSASSSMQRMLNGSSSNIDWNASSSCFDHSTSNLVGDNLDGRKEENTTAGQERFENEQVLSTNDDGDDSANDGILPDTQKTEGSSTSRDTTDEQPSGASD